MIFGDLFLSPSWRHCAAICAARCRRTRIGRVIYVRNTALITTKPKTEFRETPRETVRDRCVVCRRREMVDKSLPSLCIHCGRDLDYTRAHVVTMVLKSEIRVEQT